MLSFIRNSQTAKWSSKVVALFWKNSDAIFNRYDLIQIFCLFLGLSRNLLISSDCQHYWHKVVHNVSLICFCVCGICCDVPFCIAHMGNLCYLSLSHQIT